jgi:hypothetical protein
MGLLHGVNKSCLWVVVPIDNVHPQFFLPSEKSVYHVEPERIEKTGHGVRLKPPAAILAAWDITEPVRASADAGLINDTFVVGDPVQGILQRVNPIFGPDIHLDIEAITTHLEHCGLETPRLVRTSTGSLCVPTENGAWRLLTFIPGTTVHTITSMDQAASAAKLVGQFHRATADLKHSFHFIRPGAHDTPVHMELLRSTLREYGTHPLAQTARTIGDDILSRWASWEGTLELPIRICHGDLKISNVRFDEDQISARCLIDLDTLSPQTMAVEMGDAWRSWCNPAGEDAPEEAHFDLNIFAASAHAWLAAGPDLTDVERINLVPGIERICLELSARFCTDAIRQTYFKEDRTRHPEPGTHNLSRATGQLRVATSVRDQGEAAQAIIHSR